LNDDGRVVVAFTTQLLGAAANTIAGIIDTQVTLAFPALTTRLTRPISPSRRVR